VSQAPASETLAEMKRLEGSWIVTSASIGGTKVPALARAELVFGDGEIRITPKTQAINGPGVEAPNQRHSFLLNTSSDPKGIRLFPVDGPPGTRSAGGNYELKDDELRLRLRVDGEPGRAAGSERVMELLLREGKQAHPKRHIREPIPPAWRTPEPPRPRFDSATRAAWPTIC
jgi:uncharacterized protein (TIGR03067 family)